MSRILSLLFLIMIISGCASSISYWSYKQAKPISHINHVKTIPIWIDSNFNEEQLAGIKAAVEEWNGVFNGQIVLTIGDPLKNLQDAEIRLKETGKTGLGWVIVNLPEDSPILENYIDEGDGVLAFVRRADGHLMVVIGDRIGNRNMKTIAMHEMGHLLGAGHVNTRNSLMLPNYGNNQANCIDKVTVSQVAGFQDLPFESLNYCVTPNFE